MPAQPDPVEAIRVRAAAASPGPWFWRGNVDHGDPYLACRVPGLGTSNVMSLTPRERTAEDRPFAQYLEELEARREVEDALDDYLTDPYGEPIRDDRLSFNVDGIMRYARDMPVYEVCPDATERTDRRVYRADVVGVRHPDAEFIAAARADVDTLLAEVDRLRAKLEEVARAA